MLVFYNSQVAGIGVGAQSTLGVIHFCPKTYVWNILKNVRILHTICPKQFFSDFLFIFAGRGGQMLPMPPAPTPMLGCEEFAWGYDELGANLPIIQTLVSA